METPRTLDDAPPPTPAGALAILAALEPPGAPLTPDQIRVLAEAIKP